VCNPRLEIYWSSTPIEVASEDENESNGDEEDVTVKIFAS
jgi:hypothetical protein